MGLVRFGLTPSRHRSPSGGVRTRRIAVIDVGSNSVRLVVYDLRGRALQTRFNEKVLAGLGRGLSETGRLHAEGIHVARAALARFAAIAAAQKVDQTIAFATAAVRDAADGHAFCDAVRRESGLPLRVLDGADEARFAALGVVSGNPGMSGLVGDLGGSSLELALVQEGVYRQGETFSVGPLALDDGRGFDADRVMSVLSDRLAPAAAFRGGETFHAVGGAWRAIASIHMEACDAPLHVLHNYEAPALRYLPLLNALMKPGKKHLDLIARVANRRAATIPYAAAVLRKVIELTEVQKIAISSYGVREGLVMDALDPEELAVDPLDAGIAMLMSDDEQGALFGRALADWLQEASRHTLPERLSRAACLLVDGGALLHPDNRAELTFDLIVRAPLPGLGHEERVALALAVASRISRGFQHPVFERMLDSDAIGRARALGSLMRLAADFSGRTAELLRAAELHAREDHLTLVVQSRNRALISEQVERRLQQAAFDLGFTHSLVVR